MPNVATIIACPPIGSSIEESYDLSLYINPRNATSGQEKLLLEMLTKSMPYKEEHFPDGIHCPFVLVGEEDGMVVGDEGKESTNQGTIKQYLATVGEMIPPVVIKTREEKQILTISQEHQDAVIKESRAFVQHIADQGFDISKLLAPRDAFVNLDLTANMLSRTSEDATNSDEVPA